MDRSLITEPADFGHAEGQGAMARPASSHYSATSRAQAATQRVLDIALALLILVMTLPLLLLVSLAIRLDSPGSIFSRQERIGLNGRVFALYKLRSMRMDAEASGIPTWAAQHDPRVTRVGAFIRRTRIDEIPQTVNVLRGEMCFIGPRPERPHVVDRFDQIFPSYADRHHVKPGITGWAQLNCPYGASVEDTRKKLGYDLYYVKHRSLALDLLILISTVRVILYQIYQEGVR